ncbi:MAG: hypothetical protein QGD94_09075, partial [Planctomycetia bacterium]|nr:hypothetical protein [Planctomycetia bacterium]
TKWAKQERVLVNDWNFGSIGGPGRVLCFGEGNPLVVRTNRSGKRWVLSTKERPRKKVKMFVDAYPLLAGFLKKFCANVEIPAEMARRSNVEADLFHTELKGEE